MAAEFAITASCHPHVGAAGSGGVSPSVDRDFAVAPRPEPARMRVGPGPDLRPGAAQTGTDDDGVVLVRVAADGGVAAVEVSAGAAERLRGADALVAAVLGACCQALLKRMAVQAMDTRAAPGALPDVTDERWRDGVREALEQACRAIRQR
jgi:hypothetical protein